MPAVWLLVFPAPSSCHSMKALDPILELKERMGQSIIGQKAVVERLLLALLANGNVLMEGLPGLAKTRAIKSLAKNLESVFSRIQFTPDLLPADITGSEVYVETSEGGKFEFKKGPIFGNLILGDEINRAPAKVQAALLEAMEERQVTVAGETHKMDPLYMVLSTQNPIEQEGTYPLPEAQMDRFLMHVVITYVDEKSEARVLHLVRGEDKSGFGYSMPKDPLPQSAIFEARSAVQEVKMSETVEQYLIDLIYATRYPERYEGVLKDWILTGASPRGSIALDRVSRAYAFMQGRDHVLPSDIQAILHDCLRHRIILSYEAQADGVTKDAAIDELLRQVAVV